MASSRILEMPPADEMVAAYMVYKPPERANANVSTGGDEEPEMWDCPFPDVTE